MAIADALKPSSAAIKMLQRLGLEVVILTGDNRQTANTIAREVGIKQYMLKSDQIEKLLKCRNSIRRENCSNGCSDGINDHLL